MTLRWEYVDTPDKARLAVRDYASGSLGERIARPRPDRNVGVQLEASLRLGFQCHVCGGRVVMRGLLPGESE